MTAGQQGWVPDRHIKVEVSTSPQQPAKICRQKPGPLTTIMSGQEVGVEIAVGWQCQPLRRHTGTDQKEASKNNNLQFKLAQEFAQTVRKTAHAFDEKQADCYWCKNSVVMQISFFFLSIVNYELLPHKKKKNETFLHMYQKHIFNHAYQLSIICQYTVMVIYMQRTGVALLIFFEFLYHLFSAFCFFFFKFYLNLLMFIIFLK